MGLDDQDFYDICALLKQNCISYWVCHGTLLGIIRENRLLPWDHDIDFAVWDDENSKDDINNILNTAGYKQKIFFGEMDCLHFYGKNKMIDISFYKKNNNVASIKWVAPSKNILLRFYIKLISYILSGKKEDVKNSIGVLEKIVLQIIRGLGYFFKIIFNNYIKSKLYQSAINNMTYTGYSFPEEYMVFKEINYNNILISVPVNAEKCLEITYGKNWRVPNKNFIWYKEANNLMRM